MSKRYKAFITYAHRDERWAKWLQRSLENYRVPKRLRSRFPGKEQLPPRLYPVFRDREELASSADLSESLRAAIDNSEALIVICSPQAAKSHWVNEEIRYFQSRNRQDRIFCLLVDGNGEPDFPQCAFPPALLRSETGQSLPEPLAADVSHLGDGRRDAMLKIAAGLLHVGIDDLKQRDAQRQLRLRTAISMASVAIAVVTIGLAIAAQFAREEADLRRSQAESLISFMLEDLRDRLEPVGRLDVLDAVGDEAMDYFAVLGNRGTEREVFSRAMALRQIGEVRFRRGQLSGAQSAFEEARDITALLLEQAPDNREYLYELGQSEFWVGYAALEQSRLEQTAQSFLKYMEYSRQLLDTDPGNTDYQLELMYAYSNLGSLELDNYNPAAALEHFSNTLVINQQLVSEFPEDADFRHELGSTYSWMGEARLQLGQLEESEQAYRSSVDVLRSLHESRQNRLMSEHYGQNNYQLANVLLNQGNHGEAEAYFKTAFEVFQELVSFDPENAIWRSSRGISAYHLAQLAIIGGQNGAALQLLDEAIADFEQSLAADANDYRVLEFLALAEQTNAGLLSDERIDVAMKLSAQSYRRMADLARSGSLKPRTVLAIAEVALKHGQLLELLGDMASAIEIWQQALEQFTHVANVGLLGTAIERQLHLSLEQTSEAAELETRLQTGGFIDPRYL